MKKIIYLMAVVLMIASVAMVPPPKPMISEKDLPGLKGTWEGMLDSGMRAGFSETPAMLTIENDTVPVKFKLTVRNIHPSRASQLGLFSDETFEMDNGVITPAGTIIWDAPANGQGAYFQVSKGRNVNKLYASYCFRSVNGTGTFIKK